jgi:hypothetical protein
MVRAAGGEGRLGGSDHLGRIVAGREANRGFGAPHYRLIGRCRFRHGPTLQQAPEPLAPLGGGDGNHTARLVPQLTQAWA